MLPSLRELNRTHSYVVGLFGICTVSQIYLQFLSNARVDNSSTDQRHHLLDGVLFCSG